MPTGNAPRSGVGSFRNLHGSPRDNSHPFFGAPGGSAGYHDPPPFLMVKTWAAPSVSFA